MYWRRCRCRCRQAHFPEYNDAVADALANGDVGGSTECLAAVRTAFAQLGTALGSAAGRENAARLFGVCGGATALLPVENRRAFLDAVSDPLIPQVSGRGCRGETVGE